MKRPVKQICEFVLSLCTIVFGLQRFKGVAVVGGILTNPIQHVKKIFPIPVLPKSWYLFFHFLMFNPPFPLLIA